MTGGFLDELEALARAATPGPWFYDSYSGVFSTVMVQKGDDYTGVVARVPADHGDSAHGQSASDAAYIAACSPEVILALVAVARAAADVDGAWSTESDKDGAPILWYAEAGEILLDLKTALDALEGFR